MPGPPPSKQTIPSLRPSFFCLCDRERATILTRHQPFPLPFAYFSDDLPFEAGHQITPAQSPVPRRSFILFLVPVGTASISHRPFVLRCCFWFFPSGFSHSFPPPTSREEKRAAYPPQRPSYAPPHFPSQDWQEVNFPEKPPPRIRSFV